MNNEDYSVKNFQEFLEKLLTLGVVNESTARNLKNSSARLLTAVKDNEMDDVTKINVDDLVMRYVAMSESKPSPSSIAAYRSRTESAIKKFIAFQQGDEIPYTPQLKKEEVVAVKEDTFEMGNLEPEALKSASNTKTFTLPVTIRPEEGIAVTISGIPMDITNDEAERIASILKVYVRPR